MSGAADRFVYDRLPPQPQWPDILGLPGVPQTGPLNCVDELLERHVQSAQAQRTALIGAAGKLSYATLWQQVNRLGNLLRHRYAIVPGNRVMVRAANSPQLVVIFLAIAKIGAIAVNTMSMLRAAELKILLEKSKPSLVICEDALGADLSAATDALQSAPAVMLYGEQTQSLEQWVAQQSPECATEKTRADDVVLLAFTSGTTGQPKATLHFHRDLLSVCRVFCEHVLQASSSDVFIGTSPLPFTFGLGGLALFPLYSGASSVLLPRYSPAELLQAIDQYRASICFTVPTFYQRMLTEPQLASAARLRVAISSGEALPARVQQQWSDATGLALTEVIGSTEMLHAFAGADRAANQRGAIGPALPGYKLAIVDADGQPLGPGEIGLLAIKGPTGCRYMDDVRQHDYVKNGWNITGDTCCMDAQGHVSYLARSDDMIISSGYNISGLEVENALLSHAMVAECAVVGHADAARGQVVAAYVVAAADVADPDQLVAELQAFAQSTIAAYKYPRKVIFIDQLPRNESGKIQRFRLRQ